MSLLQKDSCSTLDNEILDNKENYGELLFSMFTADSNMVQLLSYDHHVNSQKEIIKHFKSILKMKTTLTNIVEQPSLQDGLHSK